MANKKVTYLIQLIIGTIFLVITSMQVFGAGLSLDELKNKFPDGKYWNHVNNPGKSDTCNNLDGWTDQPCPDHSTTDTCNRIAYRSGNVISYASRCVGYAIKLGLDSTGVDPRSGQNGWSSSTDVSKLNALKPGDIVEYKTATASHYIFITNVDKNGVVTFTDCNGAGDAKGCIIRWDEKTTLSFLREKFCKIYIHPGISRGSKDICNCTSGYEGEYICIAGNGTALKSIHSADATTVAVIPNGTELTVTKSDGIWAHVTYNKCSGYVKLSDLKKKVQSNLVLTASSNEVILRMPNETSKTVTVTLTGTSDATISYMYTTTGTMFTMERSGWKNGQTNLTFKANSFGVGSVKISVRDYNTKETLAFTTITIVVGEGGNSNNSNSSNNSIPDGFAKIEDKWQYYKNNTFQSDVTSVIYGTVENVTGWWYIKNGQVDFGYTGIASNANGTWYIVNGKVDFSKNGVLSAGGAWYYFKGGKIEKITSVEQNSNGWWYIKNGQVDFGYTGIASNANGTWYIVNGKVDFSKNGVLCAGGVWYYFQGGKIDFNYTGIASNANGTWYIVNGKVDFSKNGVLCVGGIWYYFQGGKIDFNYTGIASNANGTWYIVNGKVDFSKNGVLCAGGVWYYFTGGRIDFNYTGIASNAYGTWYIVNGKVDFSKNGVLCAGGGWYYFTGGKIEKITSVEQNSNGWWYIKNGQVDFNYTGIASNANGTWYILNGKVDFSKNGEVTFGEIRYMITNGSAKKL